MTSLLPGLSLSARYALSVALELAVLGPDERLATAELADRTDVPRSYLAKVLRSMSQCGVVDGLKGHHGGYRLNGDPTSITLEHVLSGLSDGCGLPVDQECALGSRTCDPDNPCALHERWSAATAPMLHFIRTATLGDLLGLKPPPPREQQVAQA